MRVKDANAKTYIVSCRRVMDEQKTEIVDTTEEELRMMIIDTFKNKFLHPMDRSRASSFTRVQITEIDRKRGRRRVCNFIYTRRGKDLEYPYVLIKHLSPRQIRLELEKAINKTG